MEGQWKVVECHGRPEEGRGRSWKAIGRSWKDRTPLAARTRGNRKESEAIRSNQKQPERSDGIGGSRRESEGVGGRARTAAGAGRRPSPIGVCLRGVGRAPRGAWRAPADRRQIVGRSWEIVADRDRSWEIVAAREKIVGERGRAREVVGEHGKGTGDPRRSAHTCCCSCSHSAIAPWRLRSRAMTASILAT